MLYFAFSTRGDNKIVLYRAPRHNNTLKLPPDVVPLQVLYNKSRPPTEKINQQLNQAQRQLETSVRFVKELIQFLRNGGLPLLKFRNWTETEVAKEEKEVAKTKTEVNTANKLRFMLQRPRALKTRETSCRHLASSPFAERLCTSTTCLPMIQFTLTWKLCACTSRRNQEPGF